MGLDDDGEKEFNREEEAEKEYKSGDFYSMICDFENAEEAFSAALYYNPHHKGACQQRGCIYYELGLFDFAYEDFVRSVRLHYEDPQAEKMCAIMPAWKESEAIAFMQKLLNAGYYLSLSGEAHEPLFIMPYRFSSDRQILFFPDLHVGKTIGRHLKKFEQSYELRYDDNFDAVMNRCVVAYDRDYPPVDLQYFFSLMRKRKTRARPVSYALYKDGRLVAGDIGVEIGKVYTSYTGYHDESSAGTVQLILTGRFLAEKGFRFWDFGPSTAEWDAYKERLGSRKVTHTEYMKLFHDAQGEDFFIENGIAF